MTKQGWNQSRATHTHTITHLSPLPPSGDSPGSRPQRQGLPGTFMKPPVAEEDQTSSRVIERKRVVTGLLPITSWPSASPHHHFETVPSLTMGKVAVIRSECRKVSRNLRSIIAGTLDFGRRANWYQVVLSTSPDGLLFPRAQGTQKGNKGSGCVYGSLPGYLSQFPLLRQRALL